MGVRRISLDEWLISFLLYTNVLLVVFFFRTKIDTKSWILSWFSTMDTSYILFTDFRSVMGPRGPNLSYLSKSSICSIDVGKFNYLMSLLSVLLGSSDSISIDMDTSDSVSDGLTEIIFSVATLFRPNFTIKAYFPRWWWHAESLLPSSEEPSDRPAYVRCGNCILKWRPLWATFLSVRWFPAWTCSSFVGTALMVAGKFLDSSVWVGRCPAPTRIACWVQCWIWSSWHAFDNLGNYTNLFYLRSWPMLWQSWSDS